jgi:hypothetical protein
MNTKTHPPIMNEGTNHRGPSRNFSPVSSGILQRCATHATMATHRNSASTHMVPSTSTTPNADPDDHRRKDASFATVGVSESLRYEHIAYHSDHASHRQPGNSSMSSCVCVCKYAYVCRCVCMCMGTSSLVTVACRPVCVCVCVCV